MLTFGLASPLLAFVLILSLVTNISTTMVDINLYLEVKHRCHQLQRPEDLEAVSTVTAGSENEVPFGEERQTLSSAADPNDGASTTAISPAVTVQTATTATTGTVEDPTGGLEEACELSAWAPHSLYWPVALIASSFWSLMVFDMVGNTVAADPRKARWAPLVALLVPLAMGAVFFVYRCSNTISRVSCRWQLRPYETSPRQTSFGWCR